MTTSDDVAPSDPALADEPVEQRSATLAWRIAGVVGLIVAATTAWIAWNYYPLGTLNRPGSAFFPLLVAALMAVASIVALVEARGATFGYEPIAWRRFGIAAGVILGGAGLLPILGFLSVALIGTTSLAILIEGKFHWKIPVTMTIVTFGIWGVFEYLLGIALP